MIQFSNGHIFEYMTASGALGYDGKGWPWERPLSLIGLFDPTLFTSVTKTLTLHPMKGNLRWYNPFRCIRFLNDGVVNTVALSNPGIDWWCKNISPSLDSRKIPLVVSLFGEPDELAKMAKMLNEFDIAGIELNASCPNTTTTILQDTDRIIASCKAITAETKLPLILKVSVSHDVEVITKGIVSMVQAISINSVPWTKIFPNTRSPLTTWRRRYLRKGSTNNELESDEKYFRFDFYSRNRSKYMGIQWPWKSKNYRCKSHKFRIYFPALSMATDRICKERKTTINSMEAVFQSPFFI